MDVARAAADWTRAEMLSSAVLVAFGVAFLLEGLGFRQLGRTEVARAFVVPLLAAGGLLLILGGGSLARNWTKLAGLAASSAADGPLWRVSLIAAIATLTVIPVVDTNANARLEAIGTG